MAHGQITHIELPADDPARARRFYSGLFGWDISEMEQFPDYFLFSFGKIESAGGAIGKRGESVGDQLRVYVEVNSIETVLPNVEGLGGKIVMGKTAIEGQGWYAVIKDSEGSEIGLYEGLPSASA